MMTESNLMNRVPVVNPAVQAEPLLSEMVLVVPETDLAISLNRTARVIWECCDGQRTGQQIADLLRADMGDQAADSSVQLEQDVAQTLAEFARLGLLNWREEEQDG